MADYITIRGRKYRVEASMGALMEFLDAVGADDLAAVDLTKLKVQMQLMSACLAAGESADGKESDMDVERIGQLRPGEYREAAEEFLKIYVRQCTPQTGSGAKKK